MLLIEKFRIGPVTGERSAEMAEGKHDRPRTCNWVNMKFQRKGKRKKSMMPDQVSNPVTQTMLFMKRVSNPLTQTM